MSPTTPQPEGWLYKDPRAADSAPKGYFSDRQILVEVSEGRLSENSLVWHASRTKGDWIPAARFKVFKERFETGYQFQFDKSASAAIAARNEQIQRKMRLDADRATAERVLREREAERLAAEGAEEVSAPPIAAKEGDLTPFEITKEITRLLAPFALMFFGLFGLMSCAFALPGSPRFLGAYVGISLIGWGATVLCKRQWKSAWTGNIGVVITLALLIWFGRNDGYSTFWKTPECHYYDTYSRWSQNHLKRHYTIRGYPVDGDKRFLDSEGKTTLLTAGGPMIGTLGDSKPHGKWDYYLYDDRIPILERSSSAFYWYGEEVTEGEWHLRNR
jgi:hypothetical protein